MDLNRARHFNEKLSELFDKEKKHKVTVKITEPIALKPKNYNIKKEMTFLKKILIKIYILQILKKHLLHMI